MKRSSMLLLLLFAFVGMISPVVAQVANDPWSQSYQAVQFSDPLTSHDPITRVMPAVAYRAGISGFLENPASMALFEESTGSFGLVHRSVDESATFLGNSPSLQDRQTGISNLGFVYRVPTVQGSLVWGAAYSQHSYYNRALPVSGFNDRSSMTDQFKVPGNEYTETAFSAYAIDYGDTVEDWDESIFRVGFNDPGTYLGIGQEAEFKERGMAGDYSAFMATEFLENFMVGLSVGLTSGRHTYRRTHLEVDRQEQYSGIVIDSNDDGQPDTDIHSILLDDEVRSEFYALAVNAGVLYQLHPNLQLGASYTLPSRLTVEEEFDGRIVSTFDNGEGFEGDLQTQFEYGVRTPGSMAFGLALTDVGPISVSLAADRRDYGKTEISFDADLFEQERDENEFIAQMYRSVWNLRGGMQISPGAGWDLRAGYGVRPSRFANGGANRNEISFGIGFDVMNGGRLELAAQTTRWSGEERVVYEYGEYDYSVLPDAPPVATTRQERAMTDGNLWQFMATFQISMSDW
ncbi:MAG: hypothetical protein ACQER4_00670 [Bacteroidota bacterium]